MTLSSSSIALVILLGVIAIGYALGRIDIKGIRLGSSGVFIVAVITGSLVTVLKKNTQADSGFYVSLLNTIKSLDGLSKNFQNIGLILFITAIGYTAGPVFIKTIKKGALNYILLSFIVTIIGFGVTLIIYFVDSGLDMSSALGIMMGSLTSTPGLSSSIAAFEVSEDIINTAHAISYPFGVLGACLFAQIMPKFFKKDLEESKAKLKSIAEEDEELQSGKNVFEFDKLGLCVFCFAGMMGILLGSVTIPGINFKLTTTGGCLIVGLLFGQVGKIGNVNVKVPKQTLTVFKELGLVFFLTGSGVTGGFSFIQMISDYPLYFVYGMIITLLPMIIGFIVAKRIFKLDILSNLGAITGAMTSTPALGALEQVSDCDNVSACYTATYPLALFLLVIIPQIVKIFI